MRPVPKRPTKVSPFAEICLDALAASGAGRWISIGGAFGLAHYYEYRETHDVDAWWTPDAGPAERTTVQHVLTRALEDRGTVRVRAFRDVLSVELLAGSAKTFSFQIAHRSARLKDPVPSPWSGIALDALDDLLASKTVALVERGAPRDFRDVHAVCTAGLADPDGLWRLWTARQHAAGGDPDRRRAEILVRKHLETITRLRPLESIPQPADRARAQEVRNWFAREFLHADRH